MVTAVWSMKGGAGVSAVACMLALGQVERAEPTIIVDLDGDIPALLGLAESEPGPGLVDWLATPSQSPSTLARIKQHAAPDLEVVARGAGELTGDAAALVRALPGLSQVVVVDCGTLRSTIAQAVAQAADQRLAVVRPCYLALRALRTTPVAPTGVVMIEERGRALGRSDIEAVAGAPVVASVAIDPSVARALDSGLSTTRLPRSLVRTMASVISR